jgi:hypothetical protein
MRDRISINKKLVPYSFGILLGSVWYQLEVKYNSYGDFFTVGLYKDNSCLCSGEPLIYGKPLFNDFYSADFPALTLIPVDEAGNNNVVNWDNFGETVFLSVYNDNDDTVNYSGMYSDSSVLLAEEDPKWDVILPEELALLQSIVGVPVEMTAENQKKYNELLAEFTVG